jgi:hypothetical protein
VFGNLDCFIIVYPSDDMLSVVMLIVMFLYCYTECHYAECPYDEFHDAGHPCAECHYAHYLSAECLVSCFYIVILSVVILNVCHRVIFSTNIPG